MKGQVELGEENANVQELKQATKASATRYCPIYQENRELRRQLAERTIETPASQSRAGQLPPTSPTMREGNVNWLKKQLREAQDVIIELREEQRMSEEKITEHFKECRPTIDNACATLSSAQSKLKRNMVLLRQVKSLNKQNWSLRKTIRDLRLQVTLGGMSKRAPFLSFWVVAWNLSLYISFFLTLTRSLMQHLRSEYSLRKCCKLT
jgi:hypothetical protein